MMNHTPNSILKNEVAKLTEELKSSTRGIIVVIINRTKDVLLRSDFGTCSGKWKKFPEDEFLYPNQFTVFASENYGVMTGVEGFIEYSKGGNLAPNEVVYPLLFSWKIPYVGNRSFDCGEDKLRKDTYSIHKSVFLEENPSQMVFTVHNDERDTTPFSSVITKPSSQTPSQTPNSNPSGGPQVFGPVLKESWKPDLVRSGQKFTMATVENCTEKLMERSEFAINGGVWRKEPSRFVLPGKTGDWGCESSTLAGFAGYVVYRLLPEGNSIRLDFATAVIGKNKYTESLVDGLGDISLKMEKKSEDSYVAWRVHQSNLTPGDFSQSQSIYARRIQEIVQPRMMPPESYVGDQKETFQAQYRHYTNSQSNPSNQPQNPTQNSSPRPNAQSSNHFSPSGAKPNSKSPSKGKSSAYFDKLNAKGEEGLPAIDNSIGLNNYYHLGNQLWDQAAACRRSGDKEGAYVNLMKFTTLVLQKIPGHLSYNSTRFDDDKVAARLKCTKALKELETIQKEMSKDDEDEAPEFHFPSVPK